MSDAPDLSPMKQEPKKVTIDTWRSGKESPTLHLEQVMPE